MGLRERIHLRNRNECRNRIVNRPCERVNLFFCHSLNMPFPSPSMSVYNFQEVEASGLCQIRYLQYLAHFYFDIS